MIHTGACSSCKLSIVPDNSRDFVATLLHDPAFFAEWTGNAFFVPTADLPSSWRSEFSTVAGTQIAEYTPTLDVFLFQFARNWMEQATRKRAFVAAPIEHVRGTLDDEVYLIKGPETLIRILPDDCNIHWRGFEGEPMYEPGADPSALALLLTFLRKSGAVLLEDEADESLLALCQRWQIPLSRKSGKLYCSKQSATTFVWFLPPGRKPGGAARMATTFACWYGIEDLD